MRWLEITVTTAPPAVEAVADVLLQARSGGVVEEPAPGGRVRVRGYLPLGPAAAATRAALAARLRALREAAVEVGPGTVETREVEDEGWAEAWKAHVRPFAVGRLWITPTWDRTPPPPGAVAVELDPGMAFGSGLHPSTRMCLAALGRLRGGETVFDVGTGSGILAIACARLGAARVLARDDDPVAVEVARRNVAHNGVAGLVAVEEGDLLRGVEEQADVILANLTADAHLEFLPEARDSLAPGGWLAAGGVVEGRLPAVASAASAAGFAVEETMAEGEWRTLVLRGR